MALENNKAGSTRGCSQAVPHPSTNRALCRLTSEVERDPVHSTRYGRQRNQWFTNVLAVKSFQIGARQFHSISPLRGSRSLILFVSADLRPLGLRPLLQDPSPSRPHRRYSCLAMETCEFKLLRSSRIFQLWHNCILTHVRLVATGTGTNEDVFDRC